MSESPPFANKTDLEQHHLFENAQRRIQQKKRCYNHTVLFLIGGVFLFITNKAFHYGPDTDWYIWVLLPWGVLLVYHWIQVFIINRFLGPKWERSQREKLVQQQKKRLERLSSEIEKETAQGTSK